MTAEAAAETNGSGTLVYAVHCPGAYARGASLDEALSKLPADISVWCLWQGMPGTHKRPYPEIAPPMILS
jgi:hypothetical protein